jgi:protein-tyrosine kinase
MSRIDEALRRAAGTGESPDDRSTGRPAEPREHAVDASILERYAPERPSRLQDMVPPRPAPVIAPRPARRAQLATFQTSLEGKLVVSRDIPRVSVEQYRRLAATLHDLQLQRGLKTLMVASAVPGEGKTLTITNLALTLSESYDRRVLLIDADLRRPSIHDVMGFPNGAGLADVLRSGGGPLPLVEISPCLSVLTAGRPEANASPLAQLTSEWLPAVVKTAAAEFDWVLLDTPPIGLLPDAQHIARVSEGVLFVIAAGSTPYLLVQRCIAELGADRIVGVVLNRVERQTQTLDNERYQRYYLGADGARPR